MKTLIINGSPRKNGETSAMTRWLREHLEGEVKEIFTYDWKGRPCVDCRYCADRTACCVQDETQDIYRELQECDNILLASPIYFSELTGSFLNLISRLQPYYYAKYVRREPSTLKPKMGAVAVVYGGPLRDSQKPFSTGEVILKLVNCQEIHPLVAAQMSDTTPALEQEEVVKGLESIAALFNRQR